MKQRLRNSLGNFHSALSGRPFETNRSKTSHSVGQPNQFKIRAGLDNILRRGFQDLQKTVDWSTIRFHRESRILLDIQEKLHGSYEEFALWLHRGTFPLASLQILEQTDRTSKYEANKYLKVDEVWNKYSQNFSSLMSCFS